VTAFAEPLQIGLPIVLLTDSLEGKLARFGNVILLADVAVPNAWHSMKRDYASKPGIWACHRQLFGPKAKRRTGFVLNMRDITVQKTLEDQPGSSTWQLHSEQNAHAGGRMQPVSASRINGPLIFPHSPRTRPGAKP
jgi:hypothetical protein